MIDYTDPASATQRLSHDERDEAVSALLEFADEGRLTETESEARAATARSAVTCGDLAPLFADLPAESSPRSSAEWATPTPAFASVHGRGPRSRRSGRSGRSRNYVAVALAPFVALVLFFISGNTWGYDYAWLWFLLVPVTGIIANGMSGPSDHDR